jgi:integral membrane protein (TIGR00529 family)
MIDAGLSLIIALAVTVVLLALKAPVYVAILASYVVFAMLAGGVELLVESLARAVMSVETWPLAASVVLVAWLAILYSESGVARSLGLELSRALRRPLLAATLTPGVLGLLPIPGGALMSAPIVDSVGSLMGLEGRVKVFVNVWYRHVTVFIYPLASMLILTSGLSGYSITQLVKALAPLALIMFLMGLPLLRGGGVVEGPLDLSRLLRGLAPIITAAALALTLTPLDAVCPRLSVVVAATASLLAFAWLNRVRGGALVRPLLDRRVFEIACVVLVAVAYRSALIGVDLSGLTSLLGSSVVTISVVLPAMLSLTSGYPSAGVVVAIPVAERAVGLSVGTVCMIYMSAFLAYLASPVHLCLVYTAQYFKERLVTVYKLLAPMTILMLAITYVWLGVIQ